MVSKAIVIHGPGRSGTTLLSNILSLHRDLGWISTYVNRYPYLPALSALNRLQDVTFIEQFSRGRRKWPRTTEAYTFWNYFLPDFDSPDRRISRNGSINDDLEGCVRTIETILKYSGKNRFITKITGPARSEDLSKIFDDPYVIYINRDPRAVVMSYYNSRWNYKNNPRGFSAIPFEQHVVEYVRMYKQNMIESRNLLEFNTKIVKYEDMVSNPLEFFDRILGFANLTWNRPFERVVSSWRIHEGMNKRWRSCLEPTQIRWIDTCLKDVLVELEYA